MVVIPINGNRKSRFPAPPVVLSPEKQAAWQSLAVAAGKALDILDGETTPDDLEKFGTAYHLRTALEGVRS